MHFTICAHFLVVRHFARPLWQPAPPIVAEPVASQPKLRLHPPLSSISIFRTLSSLFLSYFHHYFTFSLNQYLHHRNPAPAQNVPALPFPHPSILLSIMVSLPLWRSVQHVSVRCPNIPSLFLCITPQIRNVVIFFGIYEYHGNSAASINLKKTLTFTSPHHLSGEFS